MTECMTPITVHLTDEQMDWFLGPGNWSSSKAPIRTAILAAIQAQRPRPIAVGDRVTAKPYNSTETFSVEAIKDGIAWVWHKGKPFSWFDLPDLTRVDDEATGVTR